MKTSILVAFFTIVLTNFCTAQNKNEQSQISAIEFSKRIKETKNAVIVDVRTSAEFQKGHVPNALNLNLKGEDYEKQLATLDKNKTVFVYCLSGGRSGAAAAKMHEEGFKNVIEMTGGMMEWRGNNLPETSIKASGKGMSISQYQALLKSDKLILVDFNAEWCAPCKKMKPYLDKIALEMADMVKVVRIDADENSELCKNLKVTALPVLKLYKNTELVWENQGFIEEEAIKKQLKR